MTHSQPEQNLKLIPKEVFREVVQIQGRDEKKEQPRGGSSKEPEEAVPHGAAEGRNPTVGAHQQPKLSKAELMGTGSRRGLLRGCSQTQYSYKHSHLTSVVVSITCNHFSC